MRRGGLKLWGVWFGLFALIGCGDAGKSEPGPGTDGGGDAGGSSSTIDKDFKPCQQVPEGMGCVSGTLSALGASKDDPLDYDKTELGVVGQEPRRSRVSEKGEFEVLVDTKRFGKATSKTPPERPDDKKVERYHVVAHQRAKRRGKAITVEVARGDTKRVGSVELSATGSIAGRVLLAGRTDHTGSDVYLPGTSYLAKTDAQGDFVIDDVPEGLYPFLRADHDGYDPGLLAELAVPSAAAFDAGTLQLGVDLGPSGGFEFLAGDYSTDATVTLRISPTEDAILMMISENDAFTGATWQPVSTRGEHTFGSDGDKSLFIKFANANGLESAPVTAAITIDTDPRVALSAPLGTVGQSRPTLSWTQSRISGATYRVQLASEPTFAAPVLDRSGVASTSVALTMSLVDGATYHFRVAIEAGAKTWAYSSPAQFTVNLGAVTLTSPLGTTSDSTPTFAWTGSELLSATYVFELSRNAAFTDTLVSAKGLSSPSYQATAALSQGVTYYFRVATVDENAVQGVFVAGSFTVDLGSVDFSCAGLPPASEVNDLTKTVGWCKSAVAATYTLRYSQQANMASPTTVTGIVATQATLAALPSADAKTYYWTVKPVDDKGVEGRASAVSTFVVDDTAPTVEVVLADGAAQVALPGGVAVQLTVADGSGSASWTASPGSQSGTLGVTRYTASFSGLEGTEQATLTVTVNVTDGHNPTTVSKSIPLSRRLVSGTLSAGTAWNATDRDYVLSGNLTIATGVTLSIGPGVGVWGNGKSVLVSGNLSAVGSAPSHVRLNNFVAYTSASSAGTTSGNLTYQHATLTGGEPFRGTGNIGENGGLILRDSILRGVGDASNGIRMFFFDRDCFIERNVFDGCLYLNVLGEGAPVLTIENNVFVNGAGGINLRVGARVGAATVQVHDNSFLDVGRPVMEVLQDDGDIDATHNYWSTTETAVIDTMIVDKNDEVTRPRVIPYLPILSAPHPSTPARP